MAGLFIALEGGEGSGKSTLAHLLVRRFEGAGIPVCATREPGGTPLGEIIRQLIRKPALARRFYRVLHDGVTWNAISPTAELLLFAAARAQHVDALIRPAIAAGVTVICDRFTASTIAYQGFGRGLPRAEIERSIDLATRGLRPDLVVLLDVPVEVGLGRKRGETGRDQIGQESLAFHERVRNGYRALAAEDPDRWLVLDGTRPPEELAGDVWEQITIRVTGNG